MRLSQPGCPSLPSWKRSCRTESCACGWGSSKWAGTADAGLAVVISAVLASSYHDWECFVAGLFASAKFETQRFPKT